MHQRHIGTRTVSAIGLGEMPLSIEGRPDEDQAMRTVHAALDAGVTLIDTADAYCLNSAEHGHGERIVAAALASYGGNTDDVLVATKGGHLRPGDGSWTQNGDPDYLRKAAQDSCRALGVDAIGLYQFHRPDPKVAYADSIGALAELLDAGTIQLAGISNANVEQIQQAQQILGGRLVSVQNEFSPSFRSSLGELRHCGENGLAFLPWSPLGGIGKGDALQAGPFSEVATAHETSPQQVVLAWLLAQGEHVIPIPGSSRPETIRSSAQAAELALTAEEIKMLDAA